MARGIFVHKMGSHSHKDMPIAAAHDEASVESGSALSRPMPGSTRFDLHFIITILIIAPLLPLHVKASSQRPPWRRKVHIALVYAWPNTNRINPAKSRTIAVRLISMAMTGYYKTFTRPRTHRPLSMLKYDPVGS